MRDRKGVVPHGGGGKKGLGGAEGENYNQDRLCKEKSLFSIKGKNKGHQKK